MSGNFLVQTTSSSSQFVETPSQFQIHIYILHGTTGFNFLPKFTLPSFTNHLCFWTILVIVSSKNQFKNLSKWQKYKAEYRLLMSHSVLILEVTQFRKKITNGNRPNDIFNARHINLNMINGTIRQWSSVHTYKYINYRLQSSWHIIWKKLENLYKLYLYKYFLVWPS